jgi:hypothetical protein
LASASGTAGEFTTINRQIGEALGERIQVEFNLEPKGTAERIRGAPLWPGDVRADGEEETENRGNDSWPGQGRR